MNRINTIRDCFKKDNFPKDGKFLIYNTFIDKIDYDVLFHSISTNSYYKASQLPVLLQEETFLETAIACKEEDLAVELIDKGIVNISHPELAIQNILNSEKLIEKLYKIPRLVDYIKTLNFYKRSYKGYITNEDIISLLREEGIIMYQEKELLKNSFFDSYIPLSKTILELFSNTFSEDRILKILSLANTGIEYEDLWTMEEGLIILIMIEELLGYKDREWFKIPFEDVMTKGKEYSPIFQNKLTISSISLESEIFSNYDWESKQKEIKNALLYESIKNLLLNNKHKCIIPLCEFFKIDYTSNLKNPEYSIYYKSHNNHSALQLFIDYKAIDIIKDLIELKGEIWFGDNILDFYAFDYKDKNNSYIFRYSNLNQEYLGKEVMELINHACKLSIEKRIEFDKYLDQYY